MSKSIKFKNNILIDSESILGKSSNDHITLSDMINNVIITSFSDKTNINVKAIHYWGFIFVVSTFRASIIHFYGNTIQVNDILGNLSNQLAATFNNDSVDISGFDSWDHYIAIGSSAITSIK